MIDMSIEMKQMRKELLKDQIVDVSEKRVNMSFRVTESNYECYKHLSDLYKKITEKNLPNGVIADTLIEEINKVCEESIAQVLFNNQPRGYMSHTLKLALISGKYDSLDSLETEMKAKFLNEFSEIFKARFKIDVSSCYASEEYKKLLNKEIEQYIESEAYLFKRKEEQQELPIEK